ncbi:hypothetical protein D9758_003698 [Tetrapyrgos nigripes]|uniref:F-box domain-containing protein n=1 Tax=Tetrapyrgos nigripes TaxID=182062 RepID=A0A8H5LS42_9AGAR|nr:hypothetical protein D9758_003698 [Tetrapyrgos nigripes]
MTLAIQDSFDTRMFGFPSEEEIPRLNLLISQQKLSLHSLRQEILHVVSTSSVPFDHSEDTRLHNLLCEQESIEKSLMSHISLLSPIRRLPFELHTYLFSLCLPQQLYITPDPLQAPLLLASVCAWWRKIVLSLPSLWSSLHLRSGLSDRRAISLLSTWLSRTGSRPLSISLYADLWRQDDISEVLNGFSTHWRHVRLRDELPKTAIWHNNLNVPLLETFELISPSGVSKEQLDIFSRVLRTATRLERVVWINGHMISSIFDVNWSQLTHNAHNLIQLNIPIPRLTSSISFPPVCLANLQSLALSIIDNPCVLFNSLTLPALKHLELLSSSQRSSSWSDLPHSLNSLFKRSQCPLETLDIHFFHFTEDTFITLIDPINATLREITLETEDTPLDGFIFGDKILRLLSYSPSTDGKEDAHIGSAEPQPQSESSKSFLDQSRYIPCLCPRLQSIALYNCISCKEGAFTNMVRTRLLGSDPNPHSHSTSYPTTTTTTTTTPISRLHLVEIFDVDRECKHLEKLRAEGLILQVYSHQSKDPIPIDPSDEARLKKLYEDGVLPPLYEYCTSSSQY